MFQFIICYFFHLHCSQMHFEWKHYLFHLDAGVTRNDIRLYYVDGGAGTVSEAIGGK